MALFHPRVFGNWLCFSNNISVRLGNYSINFINKVTNRLMNNKIIDLVK